MTNRPLRGAATTGTIPNLLCKAQLRCIMYKTLFYFSKSQYVCVIVIEKRKRKIMKNNYNRQKKLKTRFLSLLLTREKGRMIIILISNLLPS